MHVFKGMNPIIKKKRPQTREIRLAEIDAEEPEGIRKGFIAKSKILR